MNVRIVAADEREAEFFDAIAFNAPFTARGSLRNEAAGKDIDLESDREGRRFGGTSGHHHGVDGERSTREHQLTRFARQIARRIDHDRANREFDKLVIIAGPHMTGLLRQELPESSLRMVAAQVSKDLMHQGADTIRNAVPRELFETWR